MFKRVNLNTLEDYFIPLNGRSPKGVYIGCLTAYNEAVDQVIRKYIEATRTTGVCLSGRIGNPDERQLDYYEEMMGREFQLSPPFFVQALKKWLPRINEVQREYIANSFYDIFIEMARAGKNENMQRNAYIKFMCWLYYKFEPMLYQLGKAQLPKILFEGSLNEYELKMLLVLSQAGCDILVLELTGESACRQLDAVSSYVQLIEIKGTAFPADFSVMELRQQLSRQSLVTPPPSAALSADKPSPTASQPSKAVSAVVKLKEFKTEKVINTNSWIKGDPFLDALTNQMERGSDPQFLYQLYAGVYGAEEPAFYYNQLLKWKLKVDAADKRMILIEELAAPTFEEINLIRRDHYDSSIAALNDIVMQLVCQNQIYLTYCRQSFCEVLKVHLSLPVQKFLNLAVNLACWVNRYSKLLWNSEPEKERLLVFYGDFHKDLEWMLFDIIAQTPVDLLVLDPQSKESPRRDHKLFFAKNHFAVLPREPFPQELDEVQFHTAAYQAEQDLNTIMYQDTGVYRNQQFKSAIPVPLQVTYEEIEILWGQEAKYRPNFEVFDDRVMVPVIFSKVCGVPRTVNEYWGEVSDLLQKDLFIITALPYANRKFSPLKERAYQFLEQGRLNQKKIKAHPDNPFSFIREPMQDFMLLKLQELIDQKVIIGTGSNGMENVIVATILNMDQKLLRLIQNYDFTKQIPKVIVIHTKDSSSSQEDSILLAYLNKVGFDIVMFVPTGYASVERYYSRPLFVEHQIGEYKYDLAVPDLYAIKKKRESLTSRLFRRGR